MPLCVESSSLCCAAWEMSNWGLWQEFSLKNVLAWWTNSQKFNLHHFLFTYLLSLHSHNNTQIKNYFRHFLWPFYFQTNRQLHNVVIRMMVAIRVSGQVIPRSTYTRSTHNLACKSSRFKTFNASSYFVPLIFMIFCTFSISCFSFL